jgi:hypothetical protein
LSPESPQNSGLGGAGERCTRAKKRKPDKGGGATLKAGSEKLADFTFRFLCPEWRLKLMLDDDDARNRWMSAYTSLVSPPEYTRGRGRKKRNRPVFPLVGRKELDPILMLHAVASRGGAERVDKSRQWRQVEPFDNHQSRASTAPFMQADV